MKSNRKIVGKVKPPISAQIHDRLLSLLGTGIAIHVAGVKSALCDQSNISNKFQHSCDGNEYEVKTNLRVYLSNDVYTVTC